MCAKKINHNTEISRLLKFDGNPRRISKKQFELLNDGTDFDRLREVQNRWFGVGFVPLKDKERLATAFAQVIDPLFETIKKQRGEQRASGKSNTNYSNKNFKNLLIA